MIKKAFKFYLTMAIMSDVKTFGKSPAEKLIERNIKNIEARKKSLFEGKSICGVLQELESIGAEIKISNLEINQKQFEVINIHGSFHIYGEQEIKYSLLFTRKYLSEQDTGKYCMCIDSTRQDNVYKCACEPSGELCIKLREKYELTRVKFCM